MKVTTKGRVTIPHDIRKRLGIQPGAEVEFQVEGKVVKMTPVKKARLHGRRIVEHLRGRGSLRLTTDEIMAMTRGD